MVFVFQIQRVGVLPVFLFLNNFLQERKYTIKYTVLFQLIKSSVQLYMSIK